MYVVKHKEYDIYWTNSWPSGWSLTYEINKSKIYTRRPLSRIRYYNSASGQRNNRHLVEFQGLVINLTEFEIRPITINLVE